MVILKRTIICCLILFHTLLWFALPSFAAEKVAGKTFYIAANLWWEKQRTIESTNYHRGSMIPIGTKVTVKEVNDGSRRDRNSLDVQMQDYIVFETGDGSVYKLLFLPRHAAKGADVWDLFRRYFSENDPAGEGGAFRSLTAEEQKSVLAGEIATGMSRTAVLMAYGYPPGHRTPSLAADTWIYWENRFKTRAVTFKDDRVVDSGTRVAAPKESKTASIKECIEACKENTKRTPEECFDACNR